eukprot:jgi/Mesvir1/29743/Mv05716-RA.1
MDVARCEAWKEEYDWAWVNPEAPGAEECLRKKSKEWARVEHEYCEATNLLRLLSLCPLPYTSKLPWLDDPEAAQAGETPPLPPPSRGPRNGAPPTRKTSPPLPLPPFYQLTPPAAGRGLYCLTPPPPATVYFAAHAPSPVRPVALFCTHMENEVGKALDMIRSPALEPLRRQRDEETDAQYAARVASALHACACVPAVRTAIQALHMSGVLR